MKKENLQKNTSLNLLNLLRELFVTLKIDIIGGDQFILI